LVALKPETFSKNRCFSPHRNRAILPLMHRALAALWLLPLILAGCDSQPATETDYARARKVMVETQLGGPGHAISNRRVLDAMAAVPRHEFVQRAIVHL
jgi:hypothetical protein